MRNLTLLIVTSLITYCFCTEVKSQTPLSQEKKAVNLPIRLGTAVEISENRGQMAVEINGKPFVAVFAHDKVGSKSRNSLLLIDPSTGKTDQYWYPENGGGNGVLFHMLRASNGCIYTTMGHELLEFDLQKRSWAFKQAIDGYAMSFTEGPDGKIYFGTFPNSTLWEFNPITRKLESLGRLDLKEKYLHYLAVDNSGWIYAGIGTARSNIVALNLQTKQRVQLSNEESRQVGYGQVFRGKDQNVYGFEPKAPKLLYRLENGTATPIAGTIERAEQNNTHFNVNKVNQFINGGQIVSCDLSDKKLVIIDKDQKVRQVDFKYKSNGPSISSLVLGNDGNIYGSTNHPMHLFKYQPATDTFTDYTGIPAVGGGNFPNMIAWENKIVGPTYPKGNVFIFDPLLPWTKGIGDNPNPKPIGTYRDIYRPRTAILLNDRKTVVMSGYAGYGHTGGGMVFYDLQKNQSVVLSTKDILLGHSTVSLRQLKNGNLIGGTSTLAPGGGKRMTSVSVIYEMDILSKKIISQTDIGRDIFNLEVTPNEKVIGLTNDAQLFVYDPTLKKVIHLTAVSGGNRLNPGQSLIKDKEGNIFLILSKSISRVSEDGEIVKLVDLPENATSGIVIINGELYYASNADLWKYTL